MSDIIKTPSCKTDRSELAGIGLVDVIQYDGISDDDIEKARKFFPWIEIIMDNFNHRVTVVVPVDKM